MSESQPVLLITGAARRVGRTIARSQHAAGWRVLIHCRAARDEAEALATELNALRGDSAAVLQADLADVARIHALAEEAAARWGRLDALVNNASTYYPTPLAELRAEQFDELIASNLRGPLFLIQACAPRLRDGGCVLNLLDTQVQHPYAGYSAYFAGKAGLWTLTEALALELAPRLRVNGIAPGHTIWAEESQISSDRKAEEAARIPLGRLGGAEAIANTVRFLLSPEAAYIHGAIVPVDGGLRLG